MGSHYFPNQSMVQKLVLAMALATCSFQRAVSRRMATAVILGAAASVERVCSSRGMQSWKSANTLAS